MELILASGSPRRKDILSKNNIAFKVIKAENDGESDKKEIGEYVSELSANKAMEVFEKLDDSFEGVVLGADTVVAKDGRILGKPKDRAEAAEMIKAISGTDHSVFTGVTVCVKTCNETVVKSIYDETKVFVKPLSGSEITEYVNTGEGDDKAGAYAIQGIFGKYIDRIEGDFDNVVGLPYYRLKELFESAGVCIDDFTVNNI